jgi:hypothetical protein
MKRKINTSLDSSQYSKRNKIQDLNDSVPDLSVKRSQPVSKTIVRSTPITKINKIGIGPTLDQNLRKIIENQHKLQNENDNLSNLSLESKLNILDEFIKKSFDLTEMDELLEEMKELEKMSFEIAENNKEKRLQNIAQYEYIVTSLGTSRNVMMQMHGELAYKDAELSGIEQDIDHEDVKVYNQSY